MSGLVSRDNIIAQLITLKYAGITDVTIIGDFFRFSDMVRNDIQQLKIKIPEITNRENILIIASCGLETSIANIIQNRYNLLITHDFKGDVISSKYFS